MPASWKCPQCGLVNFAADSACKRCGTIAQTAQATQPPQTTPSSAGIVLEDGYVLPPPPQIGGIWRDRSTLVMTKDASLPDYCVKCDAPANGFRLKRRFSWHHPALYLLLLIAWLIYLILAMVLRKQATVFLGLCQEHYQKRRNLLVVGWAAFGLSFIAIVAGLANNYGGIALLGLLGFLVSIIWLAFVARTVIVKKIDDQFVWLSGINENFLARFPPLQQ